MMWPNHDYRGRRGTIVERGPGKSEYTGSTSSKKVFLNSWWLDLTEKEKGDASTQKN